MLHKETWLSSVVETLEFLGGEAHYSDIYKAAEAIRKQKGLSWPESAEAIIRRVLEEQSSDSLSHKGDDIFYSANGLGSGVWGLRKNIGGLKINGEMKLFAKKFFGFQPEVMPVITFSHSGSRDALLKKAKAGDRIVYIAVQSNNALEKDRGKILGMAEIGNIKVRAMDVVADIDAVPKSYFDSNGEFLWPEGIPITKAWRFKKPVHRLEILNGERIDTQATRRNAILLSEEEKQSILDMPADEVALPKTHTLERVQMRNRVLSDEISMDWKKVASRMADTIVRTASYNNGQDAIRTVKDKNLGLSEVDLQLLLRELLIKQNYRCAITKQPLALDGEKRSWFVASADRIDSSGHYTRENIQIVTKAANKAKSDTPDGEVYEYFEALQFWEADDEV